MFRNPLPDTKAVAENHEKHIDDIIPSGPLNSIALSASFPDPGKFPQRLRTQTQQFVLLLEKSGWINVYPAGAHLQDEGPIATFDISQLHDFGDDYGFDYSETRTEAFDHVDQRYRWMRFAERHNYAETRPPMADSRISHKLSGKTPREFEFYPYLK